MRVLWLCSTPALAARRFGAPEAHVGGWVSALQSALEPCDDLELSVGFPWAVDQVRRVREGRCEYLAFPGYPRGGRWRRLMADATCRLEPASEVDHLKRVVDLSRPDLLHVWGTESFFGLVADQCPLPALIEIQGVRTAYVEVYCQGLSRFDLLRYGSPRRLLSGRSLLHQYYRYRRSAFRERRILEKADFVAGRTHWDRQACLALAPRARYFHCDRALRAPFHQVRWDPRGETEVVQLISVLRGNAYKGIETVARCAEILQRLLRREFRWTLVGIRAGEEVHRIVERKLGVSFAKLGVLLPGRRSAVEIASQLAESDVFVLPSRIENSPNGLCEAMLVGLPVVSTNAGGVPSLIENEKEGLLVPPGDPWALAGAIRQIVEETDLGLRLARAARRRAVGRHDPRTVADQVISTYRRILRSHSG